MPKLPGGLIVCAVFLGLSPATAQNEVTYDFEHLQVNHFIHGQDNWVDQPGQGQAVIMQNEDPANGTRVVRHFRTVNFNESAYLTRVSEEQFAFPLYAGFETSATLRFDANGEHLALFALGHDQNGDGMTKGADGELGPAFGVYDRMFVVQAANEGTTYLAEFGSGNAGDDWYQIELRIDFSAQEESGTGSLFYRNLSDGDLDFQPVTGLQDVRLNLETMHPLSPPGTWDALWLHLRSSGGSVPSADNLVPWIGTPASVPGVEGPQATALVSANPGRRDFSIVFDLQQSAPVTLGIYDAGGRRIRELIAGLTYPAGRHVVKWDGRDEFGRVAGSGAYFSRWEAGSRSESRRLTLMR